MTVTGTPTVRPTAAVRARPLAGALVRLPVSGLLLASAAVLLPAMANAEQPAKGAPTTQSGVAIPYLPPYANAGFVAAVKALPAGAEFRATVGIDAATAPSPAAAMPAAALPGAAVPGAAVPGVATPAAEPAPTAQATAATAAHKTVVPTTAERRRAHLVEAAGHGASAEPKGTASATPTSTTSTPATSTSTAAAASGTAAPANTAPDQGWPRLTGPALAAASRPAEWSPADVALAKARCAHIMRAIDAVTVPEPPLREGECGAPAPLRIVSIGKKPQVTLSPPALMTCDMTVALHDWLKNDVQPAARKHLHAEITQIEVMSDYSCRNAYGRARTRLSEHGRANALDIRGFITTKSEAIAVLDNWGLTGREIAALHARERQIAQRAAKSQPMAAASATARPTFTPRPVAEPAPVVAEREPAPSGAATAAAAIGALTRSTIAEGISQARAGLPGTSVASPADTALGLGMSRLGGPKPAPAPAHAPAGAEGTPTRGPRLGAPVSVVALPPEAVPAGGDAGKALFLRQIHASACRTFGTVLGPEANNAHRNHLHLDMALRATGAFCE